MDEKRKEEVWKDFWNRQRQTTSPAVVSAEWNAISKAQFESWANFAEQIPQNARVLDIATGSGKVPLMLRHIRPDLELTGIDLADPLPPAPRSVRLIGGIAMTDLPFDDSSFDAVVSQFGFEYGNTEAAAEEILRVLRPGGRIGLMVHRGDGPILAHNRKREEQIRWVKEEQELFHKINSLIPKTGTLAPDALHFAASVAAEGKDRFGTGSVGWEIPEAVRRTLELGPRGSREKLLGTLKMIEEQSENELGRIESLAQACATADARESLLQVFVRSGRMPIMNPVRVADEAAFADLIIL